MQATPHPSWTLGQWNAYVASGRTRDERRARLAEVPELYADDVKRHVQTVVAVRNYHKRTQRARQ